MLLAMGRGSLKNAGANKAPLTFSSNVSWSRTIQLSSAWRRMINPSSTKVVGSNSKALELIQSMELAKKNAETLSSRREFEMMAEANGIHAVTAEGRPCSN